LQGLVTQDVAAELPVWAGLLTAQGKCLFDFVIWEDGDDLLLDCEAAAAGDLIKRLSIYRLRRPITIELNTDLAVHWSAGGDQGSADPRLAALGRRWLGEAGGAASGWLDHRLRLGVCEGRAELGDLLWLECNAAELNGVSFSKGCFVGQENTARMNWRQKVNRRLLVAEGDGGDRVRIAYPELGLAVVHARVDALPADAIVPDWLSTALNPA
jgi:folate-binding protein YgfZ